MAKTYIMLHDEYSNTDDKLCFPCAVKRVIDGEHLVGIHFYTSDYEFHQCADCKKFLQDTVEI